MSEVTLYRVKRATPLLLVLVCVELSDVLFAVDRCSPLNPEP